MDGGRLTEGTLVTSRAGRDAGRTYVVLQVLNERSVLVVDGSVRKISNPKKKNIRHLVIHPYIAESIKDSILAQEAISNQEVRRAIAQFVDSNHEREGGSAVNGKG